MPGLFKKYIFRLILILAVFGQRNLLIAQERSARYKNLEDPVKQTYSREDTATILKYIRDAKTLIAQNRTDTAFSLFLKAYRQSTAHQFRDGIGLSLICLADCYLLQNKYDKALQLFTMSWQYAQHSEFDRSLTVKLYDGMGTLNFYKAKYDTAIYYYYLAVEDYKKNNLSDPKYLESVYYNISSLWVRLEEPEKALDFLNKAETLCQQGGYERSLSYIYTNKGSAYSLMDSLETAKSYYLKAIAHSRQFNTPEAAQTASTNLGKIYLTQKDYPNAIKYLELSKGEGTQPQGLVDRLRIYSSLAEANTIMGKYDKAESYYLTAIKESENSGLKDQILEYYRALAEVYSKGGRYEEAFLYQQKYSDLYKQLMKAESLRTLGQVQLKYKMAEKDILIANKELIIVNQNTKIREKNLWIGGISLSTLLLVALLINFQRHTRNKQRLQKEQIRNMQQEQELAQLKASMKGEEKERARIARELHDGFVSQFSAIKMNFSSMPNRYHILGEAADYKENVQQLDDTIRELRKTAHNLMPEILLQGGLAEAIQSFCGKLGKAHNIDIDFQLYGFVPRINEEFEPALYRMVQEMIQNIVKHSSATYALVQISCTSDTLAITVEDNGIGLPEGGIAGLAGGGLKTLEARVHALNGYVDIESNKGTGTTIYFEFDLRVIKKSSDNAHKNRHNG